MIALSIIIFFTIIITQSCDTTEPKEIELSSRDYIWTVDTLSYPGSNQTIMYDIWGASVNSVWAVGHNDRGFGKIYHYDGKNWTAVEISNLHAPIFYSILGMAENDIYIAGSTNYLDLTNTIVDSSLIIHYDGSNFREEVIIKERTIFSINGIPNDIYAVGRYNTVFNFKDNN